MGKRLKLTKAILDKLDPDKDGQWITDLEVPQLVVRLTKTSKTYVARWTSDTTGKRMQNTIARVGEVSVDEARKSARKLVAADQPKAAETLSDIFQVWDRLHSGNVSAGHAEEMRRSWTKHIQPDLGNVKLSRLTNEMLQTWYNKKRQENPLTPSGKARKNTFSAATVKRWISYISKLCRIARQMKVMIGDPCEGLEMATPARRLDIFTRDDLFELGDRLDACKEDYPVGVALLRFLMLYPCRGKEARDMEWSDLDLDAGTWTIPASRYKTDRDKVFPLGPLQVDHLRSLPKWCERYVFPRPTILGLGTSPKRHPGEVKRVTKNHQVYVWKHVRPKALGAHALRRTIGHMMLNNDVPLEAVSKLLGHSSTLVTQQIYAHLEPQTAAKHLAQWTMLLEDDREAVEEEEPADFALRAFSAMKVQEYNEKLLEQDDN